MPGLRLRASVAAANTPDGRLVVHDSLGDVFHATTPAITESLRFMLARLQLNDATGVPHRLALTSALRGEGVSFVAKSFAAVLAHDFERSVCLVDLNWWDSRWINEPDTGAATLASVYLGLSDLADSITSTSMPGLSIVPAGRLNNSQRPIATESARLGELITELASGFDHLVLDLPAVLPTSGALPLARFCDAYALVVRQGVTGRHHVASALDELRRVVSIGVILNANETKIPTRLQQLFGL